MSTGKSEKQLKGGSVDGASLSMGAPLGKTGGGAPHWGPQILRKEGSRDRNLSIWGLCRGSLGWAHLLGLQDMAEGVLGMECLSPWELCEGNLEGGFPPEDTEGYLEKSLR